MLGNKWIMSEYALNNLLNPTKEGLSVWKHPRYNGNQQQFKYELFFLPLPIQFPGQTLSSFLRLSQGLHRETWLFFSYTFYKLPGPETQKNTTSVIR